MVISQFVLYLYQHQRGFLTDLHRRIAMTSPRAQYTLMAWQEDDWWLVRVIDASEGADREPVTYLTQAQTPADVSRMGRDLIATILDAGPDSFDIQVKWSGIHKAEPGERAYHCRVCGQRITSVAGGQGWVWVHSDSGMIAAPDPP